MRRREFITLLGGAAAWPIAADAQQPARVRRISVLTGRAEDAESLGWIEAMRQRLNGLGWTDGRNIRIDLRAGGDFEQWQTYADELVASTPDVIVVVGNPGVVALARRTRTIPIVFVQVGDPVGSGFVASLARPGGNVTGFMHFEPAMGGKWLEMLKEITPAMTRALVLLLPDVTANVEFARAAQAAGPSYQVAVSSAGVHNAGDIEAAVTAFASERNGGLIVLPNPISGTHSPLIAELALRNRLPAIGAFRYVAAAGALASYGVDVRDLYRRAAEYVDRILKGEKTAELPVQAPTKYELVINLKTAKALGLEVPPILLSRADEVIE
jgi:putative tryptophan/tyrosine transport system substrate-binding protein